MFPLRKCRRKVTCLFCVKDNYILPQNCISSLPYEKSSYDKQDKTPFVELLEQQEKFVSFLRPRRIGKSFFISILEYYYDLRQKHKFEKIFSKTYIGQNPTPLASSFSVLEFNFSGITTTNETAEREFFLKVSGVVINFIKLYGIFDEEVKKEIALQYIFEIKYIKKEDEKTFDKVKIDASKQLQNYRDNDTFLQEKEDLHAIVVIFVKDELHREKI